ncbi:MAG: hypothetical protein ACFFBM_07785 [Promethearchaeota archaeon]
MEEPEREMASSRTMVLARLSEIYPTLIIFILAAVITSLSVVHYVSTLLRWTHIGFTLDDSWIHVQYARTVYEGRPWQYAPGIPSTGSTSPLWSVILSSIFFITHEPDGVVWGTIIISTIFYILCSFLIGMLARKYTGSLAWAIPAILGFVMVPKSSWLMLSGMEFPVFMFMILLSFVLLEKPGWKNDLLLGVIGGLVFLARPEGSFIVAITFPFRLLRVMKHGELDRRRILSIIGMGAIALLVVAPWLLHCLSVTGNPLPDTFYVKLHQSTPEELGLWYSWWTVFLMQLPFLSIGLILGPYLLFRARSPSAAIWVFVVVLILIYQETAAVQALINNTRYLVPLFDLLLLLTIVGIGIIFERTSRETDSSTVKRLFRYFGVAIALFLLIPSIPWYMEQADLYGNSVKNINEQQVVIGKWINENIPEGEIIAIVDAGALAFFGNRTTIDLVGLTTPDMVHLNLTVREKMIYIRDLGCNYIVTFNRWFWPLQQVLIYGWRILFTVHLHDNVISGADTKSVYFINWSLTSLAP